MRYTNTEYRTIEYEELNRELFRSFQRKQEVNQCWRRREGKWQIKEDPFTDDWGEEEYAYLVECLRRTLQTGGLVCGAWVDGMLKGFVSVEASPIGSRGQYLDLTSIHVSQEMRGRGIGKTLFARAAHWAGERGAQKLYISAHSAVETQSFYRAMGCREAQEYQLEHVEREPFDCQLEFVLCEEEGYAKDREEAVSGRIRTK